MLHLNLTFLILLRIWKELAAEMTKEISVIHEAVNNIATANNEVSYEIFPTSSFER